MSPHPNQNVMKVAMFEGVGIFIQHPQSRRSKGAASGVQRALGLELEAVKTTLSMMSIWQGSV